MLSLLLAAAVASTPVPAADPKDVVLHLCAESFLNDMTHPDDKPNALLDKVLKDMPAAVSTRVRDECNFFVNGILFDLQFNTLRAQQAADTPDVDIPAPTNTGINQIR